LVVPLVAIIVVALALFIIWAIYRAINPGHVTGVVVAVDSPDVAQSSDGTIGQVQRLVSHRYGLSGRPDELRRSRDGRIVPVEIKSSKPPASGNPSYPSHLIQLYAYCLLVEENYGASPPYGLMIYRDGITREVPWTGEARALLLSWIDQMQSPYNGAASPSPAKCHRCRHRAICDRAEA
jgi:CRISPR-associated exonuclease Cas4